MTDDDALERMVSAALERLRATQFVPGGVVGIVRPDAVGQPSSRLIPFGAADIRSGRAVGESTSFEIGSLSKLFTATVLAAVVADGSSRLSLDSPLQDVAPVAVPRLGPSPITIGHLVTHRAGLPKMPGNAAHGPAARAAYSPADLWAALAHTDLLFPPGTSWQYSNFGFGLLGTVLAEVTGRPFGDLVDEIVCRPLGLGATTLEPLADSSAGGLGGWWHRRSAPAGSVPPPDVATGYAAGSTARWPQVAARWDNTGALAGSGGLVSTGADMLRFLVASATGVSGPVGAALIATHRLVRATAPDMRPMGMAWQVRRPKGVAPMLFKNGGTSGMHCAMAVRPLGSAGSPGTGVVVLTNGPDHVDDLVVGLLDTGLESA